LKKIFLISLSFIAASSWATFPGVGGDSVILLKLLTSNAKQVAETMRLVNIAAKTRENILQVTNTVERVQYRTLHLIRTARELNELRKFSPQTLAQINYQIRGIKYLWADMEGSLRIVYEYAAKSKRHEEKLEFKNELIKEKKDFADQNIIKATKSKTNAQSNQDTAINTAEINKSIIESSQNQLEYYVLDMKYKRIQAMRYAKEMEQRQKFMDWMGFYTNPDEESEL